MRYLDLTLAGVENLALDEALLLEAESGRSGEILHTWEWPGRAAVLGSGGRLAEEVEEAACAADGVEIWRRSSGGGTVLLGSGCLLFSLVLAYERSPELAEVRSSYRFILDRVRNALGLEGIALEGISDLARHGRKFSGNSQQRKRQFLLHHGTILYDFDPGRVSRYLRPPPRQPAYRAGRGHQDFLCNLPLQAEEIKQGLAKCWQATRGDDSWPAGLVGELKAGKYALPSWVRRR